MPSLYVYSIKKIFKAACTKAQATAFADSAMAAVHNRNWMLCKSLAKVRSSVAECAHVLVGFCWS